MELRLGFLQERHLQVSNVTHSQPTRLQRLSGARGQGASVVGSLPRPFGRIAEAKPMDTCAYSRLWLANAQGR